MANLTASASIQPYGQAGRKVVLPVQALAQVYKGGMSAQIAGACCAATTATAGHVIGVYESDALGGATDGATRVTIVTDKIFIFKNGTNAVSDATPYGTVLFAEDDNSVGVGAGGSLVIAGRFMGFEDDGQVRVYISNQASWFDTNASQIEPTNSRPYYARAVCTTFTAASYTGTGTSVLSFANHALDAQDGVTIAVGDTVLLQGGTLGSCAITAADTGPWVVTSLGGASAKAVFTRPAWFETGAKVPAGQTIKIGPEGTLFPNTDWTSWASPGCVIGTTDPAFYPDRVLQQLALVSSTVTVNNVPIRSATKSQVSAEFCGANGGTLTNTVGYGTVAPPTAGYIGTASSVVDALASGMGKNSTADTSLLNILIVNR